MVTWARSLPLTVAAVLAMPLGVVSCVLLARAATAAFAAVLASRRFRDLAFVGVALFGVASSRLGGNVLGAFWLDSDPERLRAALAAVALGARLVARSAGPGRFPPMWPAATGWSPGSTCCSPPGWSPGCGGAGRTSWTAG